MNRALLALIFTSCLPLAALAAASKDENAAAEFIQPLEETKIEAQQPSRTALPASIHSSAQKPTPEPNKAEAAKVTAIEASAQAAGQKAARLIAQEEEIAVEAATTPVLENQKKPNLVQILEKTAPTKKVETVEAQQPEPTRVRSRPKNPAMKSQLE